MKKVTIAVAAACALGLTFACAQHAGAQDIFGDGTRLCLPPDLFRYESSNPPPTRIDGEPLNLLSARHLARCAQSLADYHNAVFSNGTTCKATILLQLLDFAL
jgi:hypothetical protein